MNKHAWNAAIRLYCVNMWKVTPIGSSSWQTAELFGKKSVPFLKLSNRMWTKSMGLPECPVSNSLTTKVTYAGSLKDTIQGNINSRSQGSRKPRQLWSHISGIIWVGMLTLHNSISKYSFLPLSPKLVFGSIKRHGIGTVIIDEQRISGWMFGSPIWSTFG